MRWNLQFKPLLRLPRKDVHFIEDFIRRVYIGLTDEIQHTVPDPEFFGNIGRQRQIICFDGAACFWIFSIITTWLLLSRAEMFRLMVERSPLPISVQDRNWRLVLVNEADTPRLRRAPKSMTHRMRTNLVAELQRSREVFSSSAPAYLPGQSSRIEVRCPILH